MPTNDAWGQGISLWSLTDAPDIPSAVGALGSGVIPRSIMRFASAAARSAAIDSPAEGMTVWLISEGRQEVYHSGSWIPVQPIPVQAEQVSDAPYNVTGTTVDYSSSAWPRPQFVAPPSGRAIVTVSAALANTNTDTSTIWAAWRAIGSLGYAFVDLNKTGLSAQAKRVVASRRYMLTGMTPGETITIVPQWNISSGTSSTASTFGGVLLVEPSS
ncbi:hypothetical protein [Streptomyces sp. NPDC086519]|uniref:hypothetical protein n=1 Tax=Streptomyces sp. NPDC086519 TaxID=3154863 RepID=UPI00343F8AA1